MEAIELHETAEGDVFWDLVPAWWKKLTNDQREGVRQLLHGIDDHMIPEGAAIEVHLMIRTTGWKADELRSSYRLLVNLEALMIATQDWDELRN